MHASVNDTQFTDVRVLPTVRDTALRVNAPVFAGNNSRGLSESRIRIFKLFNSVAVQSVELPHIRTDFVRALPSNIQEAQRHSPAFGAGPLPSGTHVYPETSGNILFIPPSRPLNHPTCLLFPAVKHFTSEHFRQVGIWVRKK